MPITLRLGLYYSALFIGNGASGPYIGVWLHAQGLSGSEIGFILAAPSIARIITGPALAVWADSFEKRRTPMAIIGALVSALYIAFGISHGFWWWAALWFVSQSLFSTLSPLADVIALRRARTDGFNFGWPRGIGSGAYIVANVGMGFLLTATQPVAVVIWMTAAILAASLAAQFILPDDPVHEKGERLDRRARWQGLGGLLKNPPFMLTIIAAGLIQASHAFYYGFSTLAWQAQGLPSSASGLLWGWGVLVEIGFLWFMEPWRRKVGPERLLVLGGAGALVRWTCLAFSPPLWLLVPVQALHSMTFTATFIGSLQLIERLSPARSASAAQTLNSALSGGIFIGLASMASGMLFDSVGALGYLAMSACAALGLVGALFLKPLQRARGIELQTLS
ncbi:MAG: MFS transporter [Caulobacteraceae bacterium]